MLDKFLHKNKNQKAPPPLFPRATIRASPSTPTPTSPPVSSSESPPPVISSSIPLTPTSPPSNPSSATPTIPSPTSPPPTPAPPPVPIDFTSGITLSFLAGLQYRTICKAAPYEVAFLGVTRDPSCPTYITDLYMPLQENSGASCEMTRAGLHAAHDWAEDQGLQPWQLLSIWLHTHPEMSATPSGTDWTTFAETFSQQHHSAMLILSKTGDTSCHVRISNPRSFLIAKVPLLFESDSLTDQSPIAAPWFADLRTRTQQRSFSYSGGSSPQLPFQHPWDDGEVYQGFPQSSQEAPSSAPPPGKAQNLLLPKQFTDPLDAISPEGSIPLASAYQERLACRLYLLEWATPPLSPEEKLAADSAYLDFNNLSDSGIQAVNRRLQDFSDHWTRIRRLSLPLPFLPLSDQPWLNPKTRP